jgi:hypothetical protein
MSKYEKGLRQRLLRGSNLRMTAEWFYRCKANDPKIQKADFTPLELDFWNGIVRGYVRWKKSDRAYGGIILARYLRLVKLHRVS